MFVCVCVSVYVYVQEYSSELVELDGQVEHVMELLLQCRGKDREVRRQVDTFIMEQQHQLDTNKMLDGLIEECKEDQLNITWRK